MSPLLVWIATVVTVSIKDGQFHHKGGCRWIDAHIASQRMGDWGRGGPRLGRVQNRRNRKCVQLTECKTGAIGRLNLHPIGRLEDLCNYQITLLDWGEKELSLQILFALDSKRVQQGESQKIKLFKVTVGPTGSVGCLWECGIKANFLSEPLITSAWVLSNTAQLPHCIVRQL